MVWWDLNSRVLVAWYGDSVYCFRVGVWCLARVGCLCICACFCLLVLLVFTLYCVWLFALGVVALTLFSVFVLAILLVCRGFCVACGFTLVPLWVCLFVLVVGVVVVCIVIDLLD